MRSDVLLHLGLDGEAAVDLLDRVVMIFGWAPPIGLAHCWSLPLLGGHGELMAERAGGQGALICSSVVSPKKLAKSAGKGGVSPRSSVRSKQTCFCANTGANTLWLTLVGNGGILQHALECILAASC